MKPGIAAEHQAKAQGAPRAARALLGPGLTDRAVSEAHCAVFHADQALLATAGLGAETHGGVQALLARHFVKDGPLPPDARRTFAHWTADRLLADDGVDRQIDEAGAAEAVAEALARVRDLAAAVGARAPEAVAALRLELGTTGTPGLDPRA